MTRIKKRLAHRQDILYVYGGVVVLVFSWAVRGFLYQLTSIRLYHSMGKIFAIFSYLMAFALLESLVLMGGLILVSFILPQKWFKEGFAYKGFLATIISGIVFIGLHYYLFSLDGALPAMSALTLALGLAAVLLIVLIWMFQTLPQLQKLSLALQERLQIFLYIYVPVGVLGLVVVVLRNLW